MNYNKIIENYEEMLRQNVEERKGVQVTLTSMDEDSNEYAKITARLQELTRVYDSLYKQYITLRRNRNWWTKLLDKLETAADKIDPNTIIKIVGIGGLIVLMAMFEKSEEPINIRTKAFGFLPKVM